MKQPDQDKDQATAAHLAAMKNFLQSDKAALELIQLLECLELAASAISARMKISEKTLTRYNGFMTSISREIVHEIRKRKQSADIQN
jgi:hypothetical protein